MAKDEDEIIDDLNEASPKKRTDEDEDQVTAAYEHINKRLESLKKGELGEEEDDDEDEIEKKGTFIKGEKDDEEEDDEDKDDKDKEDTKDSDDLDDNPGDILDEEDEKEDSDESEDMKESEEDSEVDADEDEGSKDTDPVKPVESVNTDSTDSTEPDTLDDLANQDEAEEQKPQSEERFSKSSLSEYESRGEQSNLEIPNLRHKNAGVSFGDTPFQREDIPAQRQNPFSSRYESAPPRRSGGNKLHLLILILIGLAVIGGTVYLLKGQFDGTSSPSPTPEATSQPAVSTPEPTPEFDRAKYKIRILNGTGTSGLAASAAAKLKELGYQIDKTGNASKQDFKVTEIKAKSSAAGLLDQLVKDLSSDFSNASPSGELKDSDAADAEIILGK